jgi:hypothetical protein
MEEKRAVQVVDALRERGVDAHVERPATYSFAVRVELEDKSYAVWDVDGARIMRNGVLVGFLPKIEGDLVEGIVAASSPTAPEPLPQHGGVYRRFLGGFRE